MLHALALVVMQGPQRLGGRGAKKGGGGSPSLRRCELDLSFVAAGFAPTGNVSPSRGDMLPCLCKVHPSLYRSRPSNPS